ncbi:MAG: hypothetical protein KatS3mg091_040 [Patescibacteria group bacterium]|nr:MAG: hypothetical protein KatS3mg091_040 [Patescibacteria group bacterium]
MFLNVISIIVLSISSLKYASLSFLIFSGFISTVLFISKSFGFDKISRIYLLILVFIFRSFVMLGFVFSCLIKNKLKFKGFLLVLFFFSIVISSKIICLT